MNHKFTEPEIFFEDKKAFKKDGFKDLLLAPNPKNPYPVYQVFLKSENFSLSNLNQALVFISDLDYKMKTSAIDAKTQMENFIIQLCSKGG
jgi:DNA polymerase-3 subunit delta